LALNNSLQGRSIAVLPPVCLSTAPEECTHCVTVITFSACGLWLPDVSTWRRTWLLQDAFHTSGGAHGDPSDYGHAGTSLCGKCKRRIVLSGLQRLYAIGLAMTWMISRQKRIYFMRIATTTEIGKTLSMKLM
jgi:hypothetical protein